jgi:hypothetical protein
MELLEKIWLSNEKCWKEKIFRLFEFGKTLIGFLFKYLIEKNKIFFVLIFSKTDSQCCWLTLKEILEEKNVSLIFYSLNFLSRNLQHYFILFYENQMRIWEGFVLNQFAYWIRSVVSGNKYFLVLFKHDGITFSPHT